MSSYTWDTDLVSDLHKDAYGFRTSNEFFEHWNDADADTRQAIWNDLIEDSVRSMAQEKEAELKAIADFEKSVVNVMAVGCDRKTAIRWIVDGLDVDGDLSFACWKLGLPYEMTGELKGAYK